ncbi:MAG: hypothetical protein KME57_32930 [Scytonema hyalinum WJT4-NPBG1]|nr:hypothetical protein [Scytonema hyalinum WJT4-NPBG1]
MAKEMFEDGNNPGLPAKITTVTKPKKRNLVAVIYIPWVQTTEQVTLRSLLRCNYLEVFLKNVERSSYP